MSTGACLCAALNTGLYPLFETLRLAVSSSSKGEIKFYIDDDDDDLLVYWLLGLTALCRRSSLGCSAWHSERAFYRLLRAEDPLPSRSVNQLVVFVFSSTICPYRKRRKPGSVLGIFPQNQWRLHGQFHSHHPEPCNVACTIVEKY